MIAYDDLVLVQATIAEHRLRHLLQADMLPRCVRMQTDAKSASFDIQFRDDDGERRLLFQRCLKDQGIPFETDSQRIHLSANTHLASFFNALNKALQAFEYRPTSFHRATLFGDSLSSDRISSPRMTATVN